MVDLIGLYVLSPVKSLKSVLAPIRASITVMITDGDALCEGADGPRCNTPGSTNTPECY
jgi:hypothetical protein